MAPNKPDFSALEAEDQKQWIPKAQCLPEDSENIIFCTATRVHLVGMYNPRGWPPGFYNTYGSRWDRIYDVTHWRPQLKPAIANQNEPTQIQTPTP